MLFAATNRKLGKQQINDAMACPNSALRPMRFLAAFNETPARAPFMAIQVGSLICKVPNSLFHNLRFLFFVKFVKKSLARP